MTDVGKLIIVIGVVVAAIGCVVWLLGKSGFGGMPGDIYYEGRNTRFYFPIVTCIVLSAVLTGVMWLWRWFSGR